jgi:citrate lyase subunit beta/citryl-CoA lyase
VLHPDQVAAANEVFSPRQEDYDRAELILDAYEYYTSTEGGAVGAVISAKDRAAGMRRTQTFTPPEAA